MKRLTDLCIAIADYKLQTPTLDDLLAEKGLSPANGQSPDAACPVEVVIFDTVPPPDVWGHVQDGTQFSGHTLLSSLHPKLNIIRAGQGVGLVPSDDWTTGYAHEPDYAMTDHGLFIAGLVQSAAPGANITLVEVLNKFGAGTLDGMIRALVALKDGKLLHVDVSGESSIILNLSLAISFRSPEDTPTNAVQNNAQAQKSYDELTTDFPQWANIQPAAPAAQNNQQRYIERLVEILRLALIAVKQCFGDRIVILAAAGNDGSPTDSTRYAARYPAAFDDVIGVGALATDGQAAFYSNIADRPADVGLVTFGGDARQAAALTTPLGNAVNVTDGNNGILGIYLGDFPNQADTSHHTLTQPWGGAPSANGWGRWSGTSFATGVMSAMFAKALCAGAALVPENGEASLYEELRDRAKTTMQGQAIIQVSREA